MNPLSSFASSIASVRLGTLALLFSMVLAPATTAFANEFESAGVQAEGAMNPMERAVTLTPLTVSQPSLSIPVTLSPITLSPTSPIQNLPEFVINNDGTATHSQTGLVWKRCAEGQTWNGSICTDKVASYLWADAMALTSTFAGKSDWRLPNIRELFTIVKLENSRPAIDSAVFPGTPSLSPDSIFWSATEVAGASILAWDIDFSYGADLSESKTGRKSVRLVRGGLSNASLALKRPTSDYLDNGDGTVTHKPTALTWKRCAEGQIWNGSTCTGTATGLAWANAMALAPTFAGKNDWRLPTIAELRTLVDYTLYNGPSPDTLSSMAINSTIFPNMSLFKEPGNPNISTSNFWSATPFGTNAGYALYMGFTHGGSTFLSKTNLLQVRLVRGGQPVATPSPTVSLNGLSLSCPATLIADASGSCSATAIFSDGTTRAVSPSWSSSNSSMLSIGSDGILVAGTIVTGGTVTISASYSEGGVSKTASTLVMVKVKAPAQTAIQSACSGTAANLGGIAVVGNAVKKMGVDSLEVDYCLKNFDAAARYDVYVAVQLPDGGLFWMQSQGGSTAFSVTPLPYLANAQIKDQSGILMAMTVLPATLPRGTYTYYMASVLPGKDVMNLLNQVGNLAKGVVTLTN